MLRLSFLMSERILYGLDFPLFNYGKPRVDLAEHHQDIVKPVKEISSTTLLAQD